jgi:hypothetical protein
MNSAVPLQQTANHLTIYKTIEQKNLLGENCVGFRFKAPIMADCLGTNPFIRVAVFQYILCTESDVDWLFSTHKSHSIQISE